MVQAASRSNQFDLAIAGGGLAGGLIALAANKLRPEWKIALIEAGDNFGGNHIWSFFDTDIEDENRWLLDPLISKKWDQYDVRFPQYNRRLNNAYYSIESENLDRVLREKLPGSAVQLKQKIEQSISLLRRRL